MKKILILLVVGFIIPQVTFAAWWNPFDFFKNTKTQLESTKETKVEQVNSLKTPIRLYVKTRANIRNCENITCAVVRQVDKGEYFDFPVESKYDIPGFLPEWVSVGWKDGQSIKYGYLNKILLTTDVVGVDLIPLEQKAITEVYKNPNSSNTVITNGSNQASKYADAANKIIEEYNQKKAKEYENLPRCGGKVWSKCAADREFYCAEDGIAVCRIIKVNTDSYSSGSSLGTDKVKLEDLRSTELRLVENMKQNNDFAFDGPNGTLCGAMYELRNTDIQKAIKMLFQYCLKSTGVPDKTYDREVCNAEYDPYSSNLLLRNCKSW